MFKRKQFILSIVILLIGMAVGFFLLSLVFSGPRWLVAVAFLVYFLIAYLVVRFSWRFLKEMDERQSQK